MLFFFFLITEIDYGYTIKQPKNRVTPNTSMPKTTITSEDQSDKYNT